MKRKSALLLACALAAALTTFTTTTSAEAEADAPDCGETILKSDGTPWTCTFADEFDGNALDRTKWTPQETGIGGLTGGGDCWVDNPNTVAVNAGTLKLTSRQWPWPILCQNPRSGNFVTSYVSGGVTTRGAFEQTYGRWEVRAKFGNAQAKTGTQATIWLYPSRHTYGNWPSSGEIDIAEYYSKYPDRVIPVIHYDRADLEDKSHTEQRCMVARPWMFHTYTLEWTATKLVISVDGEECVNHAINAASLTGGAPFDQPFVMSLTQTLGIGQNAFDPETTPLPQQTQIDWVHVWA